VFGRRVDDASGLSFIAMEYIEGRSLRDLLRSGHGFAYSEVARIGAALAAALDYATAKESCTAISNPPTSSSRYRAW